MSQLHLRKQLRQFCAHELTPVDLIIGRYSPYEVLQAANMNLRSAKNAGIVNTLAFIREAALHPHSLKDSFRCELAESAIWDQLRDLLYHKHFSVRSNTIFTIGKLTFRPKAKLLLEAFPHYLQSDPINLCGLMFELRWLTRKWHWALLKQIASAPHFLQRWSMCSANYDHCHSAPNSSRFAALFQKLSKDSNPVLAAEAAFRFESLMLEAGLSNRTEHRANKTPPVEPSIHFDHVANRFLNTHQIYTFAQLERFVSRCLIE